MFAELDYLNLLLAVALVLGPLMTGRFFLQNSRLYGWAHLAAYLLVALGFVLSTFELYFVWIVFCLFGFLLFLKINWAHLFTLRTLAECVPLVFSIIASIWLFSGANDIFLLGYNNAWSYYAALHGNLLGWMLIGSFVLISRSFFGVAERVYLLSAFVFLVLFLLIAFGIEGVPYIQRIGAMGVIGLVPILLGYYAVSLRKIGGASFYLSTVAFLSLLFSLYLAGSNELGVLTPTVFLDVPSMVSLHGLINGLVAIPSLYLALYFDERVYGKA